MLLSACSRPEVFRQESYVFGTRVDVAVYGEDKAQADSATAAVLREFDRLHRAYHAWEPSELTALNAAIARGEPHEVSDELAAMLRDAQQMAAMGDELFDPALGALIALWGFHTDTFVPVRPDPARLQALLDARPRMSDLVIEGNRVSSRNLAVQLDLGGYAKGYALDRANAILREQGVVNALVNIGGNVMALGKKGDQPWRIGIQHPRNPAPLATMPLYDGEAVGTSGDYQRYFELDGERYAHLLDPRTGQPAHGTQSLTVLITPRPAAGTLSDAASKPAYLAGEGWREQTRRFGIDHALRIAEDGRVEVTRSLRARLQFPVPTEVSVID
ncbi:FAD:protein FMN transferase [Azoarcus communis]|uniref:FAD:protein FMN transferase n=2 Tax=Parazoarcus communis TaxID=41977 RepID=A0A323UPI6_9RHOO|nr:FAD:protein FMN transferase [Parazoarcus communis]NMG72511.1 FAD:protein FMN transferase [Parazoarcus communis SWub3 = DSM 12120]PZA14414.1 FAD:protein FMN transferase [Azoarcus communis] [Parazoarcus communis SWub3 = DSM 12120]